jgi:hypothetical protein
MGDIRRDVPAPVVQRDAFERLGLRQSPLEPEFLAVVEADGNLVTGLVALRAVMPETTKAIARVVAALMNRLERPRRRCVARCIAGAAPAGRASPPSAVRAPSTPISATPSRR